MLSSLKGLPAQSVLKGLRQQFADYRAADNAPGDADRRIDHVTLQDGNTDVALHRSFNHFQMSVRVRGQDGDENIVTVSGPRHGSSDFEGREVTHFKDGSYGGSELYVAHSGGVFFTRDAAAVQALDPASAQAQFQLARMQF